MIISKKKFEMMVTEKVAKELEQRERERYFHDRLNEYERHNDRVMHNVYERLEKLEQSVYGKHKAMSDPTCTVV